MALNLERLVFIDESFCKTGMRREYGWSPRGSRLSSMRPGRSWKTLSLIGAIRIGQRPKLMTYRGAVDGKTFLRFTKSRLAPWLRKGDVVLLDNLNMHKMTAVRQAIEAAGAMVVYLPTYSPELNPIELLWAHLKRELRRLAVDDAHELPRAVQALRARVPIAHIAGWFRHALSEAQIN